MPLTAKGSEIKAALTKEYGEKKGEQVLYAGKNKGTFTGIDATELDDATCDAIAEWMDSYRDAEDKGPGYNKEAVQKAIEASRKPISSKEAKLIHALLKGRGDAAPAWGSKLDALCAATDTFSNRVDMTCADDHRVVGGVQIQPNASQIANTLGMRFDGK